MGHTNRKTHQAKKKKLHGEKATDAGLTLAEEIDRSMKLSLDRLVQEIRDRSKRHQDLNSKFGFLLDVQSLITSEDVNEDSLMPHCADFALAYEGDIDGSSLIATGNHGLSDVVQETT